jgi:hypothetical protein
MLTHTREAMETPIPMPTTRTTSRMSIAETVSCDATLKKQLSADVIPQ